MKILNKVLYCDSTRTRAELTNRDMWQPTYSRYSQKSSTLFTKIFKMALMTQMNFWVEEI